MPELERTISCKPCWGKRHPSMFLGVHGRQTSEEGHSPMTSKNNPSSGLNIATFLLLDNILFQDISQQYFSYPRNAQILHSRSMGQPTLARNIRSGPKLPACTFHSDIPAVDRSVHHALLVPGVVHPGMTHQVWAQISNLHICTGVFTAM